MSPSEDPCCHAPIAQHLPSRRRLFPHGEAGCPLVLLQEPQLSGTKKSSQFCRAWEAPGIRRANRPRKVLGKGTLIIQLEGEYCPTHKKGQATTRVDSSQNIAYSQYMAPRRQLRGDQRQEHTPSPPSQVRLPRPTSDQPKTYHLRQSRGTTKSAKRRQRRIKLRQKYQRTGEYVPKKRREKSTQTKLVDLTVNKPVVRIEPQCEDNRPVTVVVPTCGEWKEQPCP